MKRICAWCTPPRFLGNVAPLDDERETHGICPECAAEELQRLKLLKDEGEMTQKERDFIEGMKRCRGIDFARIGMQVEVHGNVGTIVGMNSAANLNVHFANQLKYPGSSNCHPTDHVRYFDAEGSVIADYT